VFARVDKKTENSLFVESFAGFQPVQALNEHETAPSDRIRIVVCWR
jgi:hypothetical protein